MDRTASLSPVQVAAAVAVVIVAGGAGAVVLADVASPDRAESTPTNDDPAVSTFDSAGEFRSYLRSADRPRRAFRSGDGAAREVEAGDDREVVDEGTPAPVSEPVETEAPQATAVEDAPVEGGDGGGERRASDTNVQVAGVDEPDVLKTTPETVYYSPRDRSGVVREPGEDRERDRPDREEGVRLIDTSDPAAPEVASRLDVSGKILLSGDTLVVFAGETVVGYDVSDRADPERTWSKALSSRVVTARLHAGTVYLVTAGGVDRREPCPVEPMDGVSVPCTGVHHPTEPTPVDTTYTVTLFDPADGSVDDAASFVGAGGNTVVHVSPGAVHVTYPQQVDRGELMAEFLLENQSDRLDDETLDRVAEIRGYDLGPRATRTELRRAVRSWLAGLPEGQRREAERALREDRRAWAADNKRRFVRTGIVAFDVDGVDGGTPTVEAGATGSVPGRPLNQFSADVDDGEFRVATTVPGVMGADSENDLYVLDESLDVTGSVEGMGVTERIYSVRYVGDKAYVVTFRRVDPFHVVDLSGDDPELAGELKLPGFSSYLHPLPGDRVLGIGEEDGKVKLVVFDVSDPSAPTVETDRILDARWSAVADSHHAFLMDRRHGVFFLPAGETAYVFDYTDGLSVETTVTTDDRVRRTAYVGDYLYVFDDDSVTVVDEEGWERTTEVPLAG